MSTTQAPSTESTSTTKMLFAMVGIGVICAVLIVATYQGTADRVAFLKSEALEKAIIEVLPGSVSITPFELTKAGEFSPATGKTKNENTIYAGYDNDDNLIGVAIEASGQGYADIIRIIYGYNIENQTVIGLYVLESKETPGLGDKIQNDPEFLSNFQALDVALSEDLTTLKNPPTVTKQGKKTNTWEIDGITGATISSRAIGSIMSESTGYWLPIIYAHKENFLKK